MDDKQAVGTSRRVVMKRLAAGATAAWVAPALVSTSVASAAGSPQSCGPHTCLGGGTPCATNPSCFCAKRHGHVDGVCITTPVCGRSPICSTDADCGPGGVCVDMDPSCGCSGNVGCATVC